MKQSSDSSSQTKLILSDSSLKELPDSGNGSTSAVTAAAAAADIQAVQSVSAKLADLAAAGTSSSSTGTGGLKRQASSMTEVGSQDNHDKTVTTFLNEFQLLPHMLTKATPDGRLPNFPSWSLTQLGSASVYSHSSGVAQPGFLNNTRNLLPWDVPLRKAKFATLQAKWPTLAEIVLKKPAFDPKSPKGIEDLGITVKVFLGLEYECPRGHR